jgi:protein FAM50
VSPIALSFLPRSSSASRTGGLFYEENLFRDEQKKVKKRKKSAKATLSFALDDDEADDADANSGSATPNAGENGGEDQVQRKKFRKNPAVDTSFLPDREREDAERRQREQLRQEWLKRQEEMKQEEIEIVYSYWDGSGHRKSVSVSFD